MEPALWAGQSAPAFEGLLTRTSLSVGAGYARIAQGPVSHVTIRSDLSVNADAQTWRISWSPFDARVSGEKSASWTVAI
jgi:hypothetical protein